MLSLKILSTVSVILHSNLYTIPFQEQPEVLCLPSCHNWSDPPPLFLERITIILILRISGTFSSFNTLLKKAAKHLALISVSTLSISAVILFCPGALLFLVSRMAASISLISPFFIGKYVCVTRWLAMFHVILLYSA